MLDLPPAEGLVAVAEARLRRQRGYARPLSGRPGAARRLDRALDEARASLATVRPAAAWQVAAASRLDDRHVAIAGHRLHAPRLVRAVAAGHPVGIWLCTLGPLDAGVPEPSSEGPVGAVIDGGPAQDPLAHHVAQDLATQTLYAAARAALVALAAAGPGWGVQRVSLRRPGERLWDAAAVLALLPALGDAPLGVTAPDGVGLSPPHTLLGLCILRPPVDLITAPPAG